MTIRAVLRDGVIQPIEPLPPDWAEGQELVVEGSRSDRAEAEIDQWAHEVETAASELPPEEHDRFRQALEQIEQESKQAVRKQWGLP